MRDEGCYKGDGSGRWAGVSIFGNWMDEWDKL